MKFYQLDLILAHLYLIGSFLINDKQGFLILFIFSFFWLILAFVSYIIESKMDKLSFKSKMLGIELEQKRFETLVDLISKHKTKSRRKK